MMIGHAILYIGDGQHIAPYLAELEPLVAAPEAAGVSGSYLVGRDAHRYYLLVSVRTRATRMARPGTAGADADRIEIVALDAEARRRRYRLTTHSPGWITALEVVRRTSEGERIRTESRIRAQWQGEGEGYPYSGHHRFLFGTEPHSGSARSPRSA